MIALLLLSLAHAEVPDDQPPGCELTAPIRDSAVCKPFNEGESYLIFSIESVAVGSTAEMNNVRAQTRNCGLDNRIDGFGGMDLAVYDIFNADKKSRQCVLDWISANAPDLAFSEERLSQKFENAPLLKDDAQKGME